MSIVSRIESATDSSVGRLTARLTTLTDRRPDEPRNFVGSYPGYLSWTPPQIENFTHYRLRIGHDDGEPDYEFTSGQLGIQLFIGSAFFLSTYNDTNGLESGPVYLEYDTQADLYTLISGGGGSGGDAEVTAYYEMTSGPYSIPCTPSPQSGVELIVILKQDATGGRTPSWASCFKNAPTTEIDGTASTLSMVGFTYYGGYWWRKSLETGLPDVP